MSEREKKRARNVETYIVQVGMVSNAAVTDKDGRDGDDDDVNQIRVGCKERRDDAGSAFDHQRIHAMIAERSEHCRKLQQIVSDRHCEYPGAGSLERDAARSPERIGKIGLGSIDVGPPAVSSAVVGEEFAVGVEAELGIEDDRSW